MTTSAPTRIGETIRVIRQPDRRRANSLPPGHPERRRANHRPATDTDLVARRAFELWCLQGCQHGHALDHWLQAERELGLSRHGNLPS